MYQDSNKAFLEFIYGVEIIHLLIDSVNNSVLIFILNYFIAI